MSAVGRVFRIPELLDMILQELDKKSLAIMARTAGNVHYASIRRLWGGDFIRMLDLVKLFPLSLLPKQQSDTKLAFLRHPDESDWNRFRHYSIHVRSIKIFGSLFSPDFFIVFANRHEDVFPTLRKIKSTWPSDLQATHATSPWLLMAGPALLRLSLSGKEYGVLPSEIHPATVVTMLQQLPLRAPQLKKLSLPHIDWDSADPCTRHFFIYSFPMILSSMTNLVEFSWKWRELPLQVLEAILKHPTLGKLRLQDLPLGLPTSRQSWLPELRSLYLHDCPVATVKSCLDGLSCPELLNEVDFKFEEPLRGQPPDRHLDHTCFIGSLRRAMNLTRISIHLTPYHEPTIPWRSFEALLGCKRLSIFSLSLCSVVLEGFNDAAVERLARSWIELEHLSVEQDYHCNPSPSITLYGLEPLALFCPKLCEITLTVSMSRDDARFEAGERRPSSSAFNWLNLYYSEPSSPDDCTHLDSRRIATILRRYWPHLKPEELRNNWDSSDAEESWYAEEGLLQVIQERFTNVQEFMREVDLREARRKALEDAKRRLLDLEEENRSLVNENENWIKYWGNLQREFFFMPEPMFGEQGHSGR